MFGKLSVRRLSRRSFLAGLGATAALPIVAACQPQIVEKVVERPVEVVVTREVERVVEKEVVVEKAVQVEKEVTRVVQEVVEVERETIVEVEVEKLVEVVVEMEKVVVEERIVAAPPRVLTGKLSFAYKGISPPRGQDPNALQAAMAEAMTIFKEFQPGVELEIIDLPPGMADEQWSRPLFAAQQAPDIVHVDDANPNAGHAGLEAGKLEVMNFAEWPNEPNPYSGGRPWKGDWVNDGARGSRYNFLPRGHWVNITNEQLVETLIANLDLLEQFGVDGMPDTLSEMYDLFKEINDAGFSAFEHRSYHAISYQLFMLNLGWGLWLEAGAREDIWSIFQGTPELTLNSRCKGLWDWNRPEWKEVYLQNKRWIESHKGGAASYFAQDRARQGEKWLNGQSAFYPGSSTGDWGKVQAAEKAGTLKVENFKFDGYPDVRQEDLFDKSVEVHLGGHWRPNIMGFDQFVGVDHKFRASGASENVDTMIRDMLQFQTSIHGARVIVAKGGLPQNPDAIPLGDKRLALALDQRHPSQATRHRGPGNAMLGGAGGHDILNQLEQGYYTGAIPTYEEFAKLCQERFIPAQVNWYNENAEKRGWVPADASCKKYGGTYIEEG